VTDLENYLKPITTKIGVPQEYQINLDKL
jgi:hypothetical protein